MCRSKNSIDVVIHTMCMVAMTDEKKMAALGGRLLTLFHAVCRSEMIRAENTVNELCFYEDEYYDPSEEARLLNQSVLRLAVFMEDGIKDKYDREITSIFEFNRMIKVMEALKYKVYNGSKYGPELVSILSTCYMNSFDYSCEEASEVLNMSISTFYRKKRRAEILFGLAFLEYTASIGYPLGLMDPEGTQLAMAI